MASQVLSTATTRAAISMHGSQSRTEAETAAFGYPARALVFKLRVRKSDLWLSATCAVVTASDGLTLPSRGGHFRSRSPAITAEIIPRSAGAARPATFVLANVRVAACTLALSPIR